MREKAYALYRVFLSVVFLCLLLFTAGSLRLSASLDVSADAARKMPPSVFFAAKPSGLLYAEEAIIMLPEWFPEPEPEPDESNGGEEDEILLRRYDFSMPVPPSEPSVDDSYFADALFIGDSRTVGLLSYSGVDSYYYAKVALTIRGVLTNEFIEDSSSGEIITRSVIETIRKYPVFRKIYISFGLNELGWAHGTFIKTYEHVLDTIREILPDAQIFIQAIIPVSREISEEGTNGVRNETIHEYNRQLAGLAEKKQHFFLAIDDEFADEDGNLVAGISSDGIHFGGHVCRLQMDYFRAHTVRAEDYAWD